MKIKAKDMKICFNCQFADAFIVPDVCHCDFDDIKVECVKDTTEDVPIRISDECPHWERKTSDGKIILKD